MACRMRLMSPTAEVTDRAGAWHGFTCYQDNLADLEKVLIDGGYTGAPFAGGVKEILGATFEVAKRNELHTFAVNPKRWVVERSFGWLENHAASEKTASETSIPAETGSFSPSSLSCLKDYEPAPGSGSKPFRVGVSNRA